MWYNHIYLQTYITAIAVVVGVFYMRQLSTLAKLILLLVFANTAVDVFATYIDKHLGFSTHLTYSIFTVCEIIYIVFIYSKEFTENSQKFQLYGLIICIFIFSLLNLVFVQGYHTFNTITFSIAGLATAILSYLTIRREIKHNTIRPDNILVWFSIANLVFYLGSMPVMTLITIQEEIVPSLMKSLLSIKNLVYSIWSILISIGFLCQKKQMI